MIPVGASPTPQPYGAAGYPALLKASRELPKRARLRPCRCSSYSLASDRATLATQGDGVLLVSDAQTIRERSVRQAMRSP